MHPKMFWKSNLFDKFFLNYLESTGLSLYQLIFLSNHSNQSFLFVSMPPDSPLNVGVSIFIFTFWDLLLI